MARALTTALGPPEAWCLDQGGGLGTGQCPVPDWARIRARLAAGSGYGRSHQALLPQDRFEGNVGVWGGAPTPPIFFLPVPRNPEP